MSTGLVDCPVCHRTTWSIVAIGDLTFKLRCATCANPFPFTLGVKAVFDAEVTEQSPAK